MTFPKAKIMTSYVGAISIITISVLNGKIRKVRGQREKSIHMLVFKNINITYCCLEWVKHNEITDKVLSS